MKRKPNRSLGGNALNIFALSVIGFFMLIPMVYTVNNAFKPLEEFFIFPPRLFVLNPTLTNFMDLPILVSSGEVPFARFLFNTVFITAAGTGLHALVASLGAFTVSKYAAPGMKAFFKLAVFSLMFAGGVTMVPNYIIMSKFRWIDTYYSLIVPAIGSSLGFFLMKQFMDDVPDALMEAARIDGANILMTYWRVAMPAVKPGWITMCIFMFQALWGVSGGIYIHSEQLKTLPYALSQITTSGLARAGVGAAIGLIMMIVPIALFIVSQRSIVETMTTSGIKE